MLMYGTTQYVNVWYHGMLMYGTTQYVNVWYHSMLIHNAYMINVQVSHFFVEALKFLAQETKEPGVISHLT